MHTITMGLDIAVLQDVFGVGDVNLKTIEQHLGVSVLTRDGTVEVKGESAGVCVRAIPRQEIPSNGGKNYASSDRGR